MMRCLDRPTGSTLFVALIVLAALSFFAAFTLQRLSPGLRMAYQNAAWQEARVAAESGIDAAMSDLVRYETGTNSANAWQGWRYQTANGPAPVPPNLLTGVISGTTSLLQSLTSSLGLGGLLGGSTSGGSTTTSASSDPIYLDNVKVSTAGGVATDVNVQLWALQPADARSKATIRVRSMATCALPPAAYEAPLNPESALRRFSLRSRRQRVQQDDVGAPSSIPLPNVSRTVEVLAEPITPFELAMWTQAAMSLPRTGQWVVDSYDSRDPAKSGPNGVYPDKDSSAVQAHGNIASNLTRPLESLYGPLIAVNGAAVRGWIATNGGDDPETAGHENVSGALEFQTDRVRDDFQREMKPVFRPDVAMALPPPFPGTPFAAGTAASPTYYHCPGNLGAFTVSAPAGGATGAIIIAVDGDLDVDGAVIIPTTVAAEVYVRGNVYLHSSAVNAGPWNSNRAAQLLIFGEGDGNQPRRLSAQADARVYAAFYGPSYSALIDGTVNWCGCVASKTFAAPWGGDGGIHYDAALASIGPPISFRIIKYIDDVRQ